MLYCIIALALNKSCHAESTARIFLIKADKEVSLGPGFARFVLTGLVRLADAVFGSISKLLSKFLKINIEHDWLVI